MKNLWKNLLLILASVVIGFMISELFFRIYYYQKGIVPFVTEDERCRNDIYAMHKNLLESKNFNLENRKHVTHPVFGWEPKPNFAEGVNDELVIGNSTVKVLDLDTKYNSEGLRSTKEYTKNKPNGTTRIAVFGDSSTLGVDVTQPFSYSAVLEQLAKNTEVINFGVSGYGVDQMYLRFLNKTSEFENNAVIMGIFTDDLRRSATSCKDYLKPRFIIQNGNLKLTNTPIPTLEEFLRNYKRPIFESYFAKHVLNNINHINLEERQYEEGFSISKLILRDIKSITQKKGMFFVVVIMSPSDDPKLDREFRLKLRNFLEEQNIAFIDSVDVLAEAHSGAYKNYYLYVTGGHFNNLGNALIAQKIKNVLEENKIIGKTPNYQFASNSFIFNEVMVMQNLENASDVRYITNIIPANGSFEIPKQYVPFKLKT